MLGESSGVGASNVIAGSVGRGDVGGRRNFIVEPRTGAGTGEGRRNLMVEGGQFSLACEEARRNSNTRLVALRKTRAAFPALLVFAVDFARHAMSISSRKISILPSLVKCVLNQYRKACLSLSSEKKQ